VSELGEKFSATEGGKDPLASKWVEKISGIAHQGQAGTHSAAGAPVEGANSQNGANSSSSGQAPRQCRDGPESFLQKLRFRPRQSRHPASRENQSNIGQPAAHRSHTQISLFQDVHFSKGAHSIHSLVVSHQRHSARPASLRP
jgi:hypothetical protein